MSDDRPSISYAATGPLDPPGSPCRIEHNAEGLFITIPPAKLWVLMSGPSVGLSITTVFAFVGVVALCAVARERGRSDPIAVVIGLSITLVCFALLWYQVLTIVKLARHGRNPVRISVTEFALTVENGVIGEAPEFIKLPERVSIVVQQSVPTLTLGRIVDMKFDGIDNFISIRFYTRQRNLARELKSVIERRLEDHAAC